MVGLLTLLTLLMLLSSMSHCMAAAIVPSLTQAERAWLAGRPVVRFAVDPQWRPVEYVDGHVARGLSVAYLQRVADSTGLRIEWVPMPSWAAAVHAFSSGQIDVLPGGFTDIDELRLTDPLYSQPYYVGASLIVGTNDGRMDGDPSGLSGKLVAVEEHGKYQGWFGRHYPSVRLVPVADEMSALQAVADGRADAAVVTDAVALPLLHDRFAGVLYAVGTIPDVPTVMRMAIRPEQPMLASVVNKALAGISARDAMEIDDLWLSRADFTRPSLTGLFRYDAIAIAFALVAILALVYGWYQACRTRDIVRRSAAEKALFLATMSHEIRGPIHAIVGPLELLSKTGRDANELALLDAASNAGYMLTRLLDDLLEHFRLEAGGIRLDLQRCQPVALVASVMEGHRDIAMQKGLRLSLRPMSVKPAVFSDPVRIRQVIDNLLSNALKFTLHGSVMVTVVQNEITVRDSAESMMQTVIEVQDTGSGIAPEALATLFKPFVRAKHSLDKPTLGNGLGLMISRQLATLLGGSLTLESERGVGTVARFVFVSRIAMTTPGATSLQVVADPTSFAKPVPIHSIVVPEVRSVDDTPMCVLVADDHKGVQIAMMHQLRRIGFECDAVSDIPTVAEALRSGAYCAALVDWQLGEADTFETIASYRRHEVLSGARHLPIIGISATADETYADRCLVSGFDGILRKPIRLEHLTELLAMWFPTRLADYSDDDTSYDVALPSGAQAAFEAVTARDIQAIKRALDEGNIEKVVAYAHRIAGAASFVDCPAVVGDAARTLELAARAKRRLANDERSATHVLLVPLVTALERGFAQWQASG